MMTLEKSLNPQKNIPSALGYFMPAEWEPHQGTWLSWPHNQNSWPGKFASVVPIIIKVVQALIRSETVHINVLDADHEKAVGDLLKKADALANVIFHQFPTNDAWCRDHGAIFVKRTTNGHTELAAIDCDYNAWGEKYPPYDLDNLIPSKMANYLDIPIFKGGLILEGGSIDVNGEGLLLTSEQCLLNPNRNPQLCREEIETRLKQLFYIKKILWLGEGIVGDDTDGHVDDITRFVSSNTILTVVEEDPADDNYQLLQDNLERLQKMTDLNGQPLIIKTLPMPHPVIYENQRLPASYANFYIANKVILLPIYNCPNDKIACSVLQECFPTREVVAIDCSDLIWGLGAFHCLTQQIPAV